MIYIKFIHSKNSNALIFIKKILKKMRINVESYSLQIIRWWLAKTLSSKIVKHFRFLLIKRNFFYSKRKILLDKAEIKLIKDYLEPNDLMLEWGSGLSTIFFSQYVKKYYSIEHNFRWFYWVKKRVPNNVKIEFVMPNLPITIPSKREQFKEYIEIVHKLGVPYFCKVFIDGRARQWCAEEVLSYINNNSIVFIHDFYTRERYLPILDFYEKIDGIKKLIVLRKKK